MSSSGLEEVRTIEISRMNESTNTKYLTCSGKRKPDVVKKLVLSIFD